MSFREEVGYPGGRGGRVSGWDRGGVGYLRVGILEGVGYQEGVGVPHLSAKLGVVREGK